MVATVTQRQNIERAVIRAICEIAFAHDYTITVIDDYDPRDGSVVARRTRDMDTVMDVIMSTDGDTLRLYRPDGTRAGSIFLVYGNDGYDVINDHSLSLECMLSGVFELCDRMELSYARL